MASLEWIKMTWDLADKVQTRRLARLLKLKIDDVVGKLFRFWVWAEHQSDNGHMAGLVSADVDAVIGKKGFASALAEVGWLVESADGLDVPGFDRHMGAASRKRDADADRQRRRRDNSVTDDGRERDSSVTGCGQERDATVTQEKEREKEEEEDSSEPATPASEPTAAQPSEEPILAFPVVGKGPKTWGLTPSQVSEWAATYPGLDVLAECRKALAWVKANPTKTKTARGMPAFLNRWLASATDRGSASPRGSPFPAPTRPQQRIDPIPPQPEKSAPIPWHLKGTPETAKEAEIEPAEW